MNAAFQRSKAVSSGVMERRLRRRNPLGYAGFGLNAPERAKGIEPSSPAWKAGALPLSYARGSQASVPNTLR